MSAGSARLLLACLLAASASGNRLAAQDPGSYGPGGGMGPGGGAWQGGGGRGMRPGRGAFDAFDLPTPEEIDGPPTPGTLRQLLALDDSQSDRYTRAWDSLMADSKPQRDSARAAREAMRSAFRERNRDGAREQATLLARLGKDLRKRDETFDKSLAFLTADQRKQYEDYKKEQKKAREEERRHRPRDDATAGARESP